MIFSYVDDYRDSWKLFRRLFLVDNISGRQEASSEGKRETLLILIQQCTILLLLLPVIVFVVEIAVFYL